MKNILVTGANGQLGNEMRLLAEKHQEFCYFFTDVAELDICDKQAVRKFVEEHQIDVIVNCAAYTAVDKAEDNVELCDKLNHLAPGYLARQSRPVTAIWCKFQPIMFLTERLMCLTGKTSLLARILFTDQPNWQVSRRQWLAARIRWLFVRHGFIPLSAIIL